MSDSPLPKRLERLSERASVGLSRRQLLAATGIGTIGLGVGVHRLRSDDGQLSDHEAIRNIVRPEDATHVAANDGAWTDTSTWNDGSIPGDDAVVHVPDGVEVTLASEQDDRLDRVLVDGHLRFEPTMATKLRLDSLVVGHHGRLTVGTPDDPVTKGATVEFLDRGPIDEDDDPAMIGRGLLSRGDVTIVGEETTPYATTATRPRSGDTSIELSDEPTNWTEGDRILLPGLAPESNQDEEHTITAIEGRTVHLDEALYFDHVPPEPDLDTYVALLERPIEFVSESDDVARRGHTMFMQPGMTIRHAGFFDLGRTDKSRAFTDAPYGTPVEDAEPNPRGRYAVHFHITGVDPEGSPHEVTGCLVWDSPGWGYVNHHGYAEIEDCVSYDVLGSGFVTETGAEIGTFRRNLAVRSEGSGSWGVDSRQFTVGADPGDVDAPVDDFGHTGHGFWFQGPSVVVEENVACGHRHYGFVYWNRGIPNKAVDPENVGRVVGEHPNYPVENLDDYPELAESDDVEDGRVPSSLVPVRSFSDNEVFASGGGMEISRVQFGHFATAYDRYTVVDGFTAYNIGPYLTRWESEIERHGNLGIKFRYCTNVIVRNARLYGGGTGDYGITRNIYAANVVIEDSTIEGWETGVEAILRGHVHIRNSTLENETNVALESAGGVHWHRPHQFDARETTFSGGSQANVSIDVTLQETNLYNVLSDRDYYAIDGRRIYPAESNPDVVPYPSDDHLEEASGGDRIDDLASVESVEPSDLVGLSNSELYDEYGLSVGGRPLPDHAQEDDRVSGGYLAPESAATTAVWLPAEDGAYDGPFREYEGEGAATGAYLAVGDVSSERSPPSQGRLSHTFEVPSGEYTVWGRLITPGEDANTLWARVDDEEWVQWGRIDTSYAWQWVPIRPADDWQVDAKPYDLGGTHELEVAYREPRVQIDGFCVVESDVIPFGPYELADAGER